MASPIIYINGWPGVGKHTIATELALLMGHMSRVVHNHHHIDLAGAILPRSSSDYLSLRRQLRAVLFNTLATCPDTYQYTYIFTDFQSDDEIGSSVAEEFAEAAKQRGCLFAPVRLCCDGAENERRMRSADRLESVTGGGKGMLLDGQILREMRGRSRVYSFEGRGELNLDVSQLEAKDAAKLISDHLLASTRAH